MTPSMPTQEQVNKVIESATEARNQLRISQIEDIKDTISHSTWLAMLAIGIIAASTTLAAGSSSTVSITASAASIFASAISVVFSSLQSVLSNNLLHLHRKIMIGNLGIKVELLAGNHTPQDLEKFSQDIYSDKITSKHFKESMDKLEKAIDENGSAERYANWQMKALLAAVFAFSCQGLAPAAEKAQAVLAQNSDGPQKMDASAGADLHKKK